MDETDRSILRILQNDGKLQYHLIAKQLGMVPSSVHYRVKRMLKDGIIKRFSAVIDPEKVGLDTTAWIGLSVDGDKIRDVAERMVGFDRVQHVTISSGAHDILMQVVARDEKDLWQFINEDIKTIEGVHKEMHVSTHLEILKRTGMIPI